MLSRRGGQAEGAHGLWNIYSGSGRNPAAAISTLGA
jgi:hypothetical protein